LTKSLRQSGDFDIKEVGDFVSFDGIRGLFSRDDWQFAHLTTTSFSPGSNASGNPVKPPSNISTVDCPGLLGQNEKNCLKCIFCKMLIVDQPLA
jgi:hypothetical protein